MAPTEKQDAAAKEVVKKQRKPRFKKVEHDYPVEPRIIQVIKKPKTFVDHSYRDFSIVPPDLKYEAPSDIEKMTFAEKVHDMLSDERYSNWIQWLPHGRGFQITVPKRLEQSRVLQKYFGHNRFSSFLRQLNNHGFKHVTRGVDRNSYYHECFLRGMKHLLKYMPPGRDARRLMPDPDNEPDLYAIARVCPLVEPKAPSLDLSERQGIAAGIPQLQTPNVLQGFMGQSPRLQGLSGQGVPQLPLNFCSQPSTTLQQAASLQQAATLQQQAASLHQPVDVSRFSSMMNQTGFQQGGVPSMQNQGLPGAQLGDDPAMLALLLRSRGQAGNSLFNFQN